MRSQPMFPGDGDRRVITSGQITGNNVVNRGLSPMEIRSREVGLGVYVVDFLMFPRVGII